MVTAHNLISRGCRNDDLDFVHDLSLSNMKEYVDRFWGGWKEEIFWADINKDNITIIEQDRKRVGFFDVVVEGDAMRIRNIQVAKDSQGRGIGKYIMNLILEETKNLKIAKILLRVFADNPAVGFYERFGFCKVGKDESSLMMEKTINIKESK